MSVSIITCPSCDAMLLDDTVQCPSCQHVLRPDEHTAKGFDRLESSRAPAEAVDESKCPACGEGVRHGLVRCWNCGTFMNQQVQQSFLRQVAGAGRTIDGSSHDSAETSSQDYSSGTRPQSHQAVAEDIPLAPEDPDDVSLADDDDFEISPEFSMRAPSEHLKSYRVRWNEGADEDEVPAGDGTYRIAGASAEDSSDTVAAPIPSSTTPAAETSSEPASQPASAAQVPKSAQASVSAAAAHGANGAGPIPPLDGGEAHSVATAGDVLLQIALEEEQQQTARKNRPARKRTAGAKPAGPRSADGVMVFCPNGHRIEVRAKHRGLMGRCPKCKMPFFVPQPAPEGESAPQSTALDMAAPAAVPAAPGAVASSLVTVGGVRWMNDVALHAVNLAKVKPKPGCLAKAFQPVDLAFLPQQLAVVTLTKAGGLFGGGAKKVDAARQAAQTHLSEGKPVGELPAAAKIEVAGEALPQLKIVQPAVYAHESPFGDVKVFGEGRIAVQLPAHPDAVEKLFLSFPLSHFRDLVETLRAHYGLASFGENCGVPLTDSHTEHVCHYSETKLSALNEVPYYQADPVFTLEIIGRQCEGCGLIVSEDARKKEKIGGLDGKGVAKAKCPKCAKKFGDITLYRLGTK